MLRLRRAAVAVMQLSLAAGSMGLTGCAGTRAALQPTAALPTPAAPAALTPPADAHVRALLAADASGTQDYACVLGKDGTYAWTLRGPDAVLFGAHGARLGRHFAGPTWEWSDGSAITGALAAKADAPDAADIPWLLVSVKEHQGATGALAPVRFVQRLATKGGKAPSDGCDGDHAGQVTRVPYSAHYVFLGREN
ncbi:MAG TPA: DUF3455 domain-containing protein [Polyangia bacterium]|nr:DUF3455 domain-containing protein [Polyangia bacterium]